MTRKEIILASIFLANAIGAESLNGAEFEEIKKAHSEFINDLKNNI